MALERAWKPSTERTWRTLPETHGQFGPNGLVVPYDLNPLPSGRVDLRTIAYAVAPPVRRHKSAPTPIRPGAALTGAFGMEDLGPLSKVRPTCFRIGVHAKGRTVTLLKRCLRTVADARQWHDYRVPLDRFAGTTVRFSFSAGRHTTPSAWTSLSEATVPVWSEATVVEPLPDPSLRNVVLISLDTLRADHLGVYGSTLPTSPHIDRLAAEGTVFERVASTFPSTTASHASMLSGVYPNVHGAYNVVYPIAADVPLLAERLATEGYRTLAVTEDAMISHLGGFRRGFSRYREYRGPERTIETPGYLVEGIDTALSWLATHRGERFFLFLHTYTVHNPFTPPPEDDVFRTYRDAQGVEHPIDAGTPTDIRDRHAYAGEIRFADRLVGRLLERLREVSPPERTIVLITADHGEAFDATHGASGHGYTLAEEVLHVPLVVLAPGLVPAGRRVAARVSLIDIPPTILELLHRPVPPAIQGRSLVPLLRDPAPPELLNRALFAETRFGADRQIAVYEGRYKWIVGTTATTSDQLYDIVADPIEAHPLQHATEWARGAALAAEYRLARDGAAVQPEAAVAPDAETQRKLQQLGYVE